MLFLLLVYLVLAHVYSLSTPLFEAPDAYYHFAVIEYISRTGHLPPTDNIHYHAWRQMAFHAPLYYVISATLIKPIDTSDFLSHYPLNPHAQIGNPAAQANRNFIAHTGDPWHDTGLAVRVVREFSILLGAVTLVAVYGLGRQLFPQRRFIAFLAVMLILFNPQFLYISGVVNNDNLVMALASMSLALLVYIIRDGVTLLRLLLLAVLAALTALSKASGITLYPAVCAGLLWVCWRDKVALKRVVIYALIGLLAFLVIAGWWYARNWQQYGDPTATNMVAQATHIREAPIDLVSEMRGLYYSFWGLFGWFNVLAPQHYYEWVGFVLLAAVLGVIWQLVTSRPKLNTNTAPVILILFTLTFLVAWWRFETMVLAAQGRLWFPMLGVFAYVIAYGLASLRRFVILLLLPLMFAVLSFPFALIQPAYAGAPQIEKTAWHPAEDQIAVSFREPWNDTACAVLWLSPSPISEQDNMLIVDLAWEASCSITGYWSVFVHVSDLSLETCEVGGTNHILSQYDSMPADGNMPFPAIKPGYVIEDHIAVPMPDGTAGRDLHLQVGLYDAGGTFIRAFVSKIEDVQGANSRNTGSISIGRCSPELVNIAIPSSLLAQ